ncbi:MAG: DUF2283 domain-containing protein [Actinomycetota bacterium]
MTISAYTVPEGGILMINVSQREWDRMDVIGDYAVAVDLDAEGNVIGIEVLDPAGFDLAAVAAEYGISDLVPEIEAAIAAAKPGP